MTRTDMIDHLAERAGLPREAARCAVAALFGGGSHGEGMLARVLGRDGRLVIAGFGTFTVRARAPRTIRDPRSGAARRLPASRTVGFRPAAALRECVR